jgi:transposase
MMLGDWPSWRRLVPGSKVKSEESQRTRAILVARPWSVGIRGDIENQVRSIVGEYGLLFSIALGFQFRKQIIELQDNDHQLHSVVNPVLLVHDQVRQ